MYTRCANCFFGNSCYFHSILGDAWSAVIHSMQENVNAISSSFLDHTQFNHFFLYYLEICFSMNKSYQKMIIHSECYPSFRTDPIFHTWVCIWHRVIVNSLKSWPVKEQPSALLWFVSSQSSRLTANKLPSEVNKCFPVLNIFHVSVNPKWIRFFLFIYLGYS